MEVHISCIQKFPNQIEESLILDLLFEDGHEGSVMDFVEASANVSFDKPVSGRPFPPDFSQSRVTTAVLSKSVTCFPEIGCIRVIINRREDQIHDLLDDFVPYTRNTEFSHLAIRLRDESDSHWLELKLFGFHLLDNLSNGFKRKSIEGFPVCSR